jgi:hypothetical protein
MAFLDCLSKQLSEGNLDQEMADRIETIFKRRRGELEGDMGEEELVNDILDNMEGSINEDKYAELLQLDKRLEIDDTITETYDKDVFKARGKSLGNYGKTFAPGEALVGTLTFVRGEQKGIVNVELLQDYLRGKYFADMSAGLREMSQQQSLTNLKGLMNEPNIDFNNVMRQLNGEDVKLNDMEQTMAEGVRRGLNRALMDYRMAGGRIPFRENYIPNPDHSAQKLRDIGRQEWIEDTMRLLDSDKMVDFDDGHKLTDDELEDLLDDMYDNITKKNIRDADLGERRTIRFNERQGDRRILHFEDYDSWREYNDKYSSSVTPIDSITSRIDKFAKDTAFMRRFGPNVDRGKRVAKDIVQREADRINTNFVQNDAQAMKDEFDSIWNGMMGMDRSAENVSGLAKSADTFNTLAQAGTIASAGPTVVAGDITTTLNTALADGLPAGRIIGSQLKNLINWSRAGNLQQVAAEAGFGADAFINQALGQARFYGEMDDAFNWGKAIGSKVTQLSGVTPWTAGSRAGFNVEFSKFMAKLQDYSWDELGKGVSKDIPGLNKVQDFYPKFRDTLERYNITQDDWRVLRQVDTYSSTEFKKRFSWMDSEFKMLRPNDIVNEELAEKTGRTMGELEELAQRYFTMIKSEEKFATPTITQRVNETLGRNIENTVGRKIMETSALYKSFPMMIFQSHIPRIIQQGTNGTTAGLFSTFMLTMTLAGTFSMQMSEISKGNNPRSLKDPSTWQQGAMRGGGLSFIGEAFFGDPNKYGKSIGDNFFGPGAGMAFDTLNIGRQAVRGAVGDEDATPGRDLSKYLERWSPGGNMWWARPVLERAIWDNLQRQLDPNFEESIQSEINFRQREFNQDAWWGPGESIDEAEAPDLGALTE